MLSSDEVEFTTKYLAWIHAVERMAKRRLTSQEIALLIGYVLKAGFLQQEETQQRIMAATDEFLVSLRVDEYDEENIIDPE
jgi:hypothetical protein